MVNSLKLLCFILGLLVTWEFSEGWAAWEQKDGGKALEDVKLLSELKGSIEGSTVQLKAVGAGLRVKKVLFVKAKVYVAELFLSSPEKFQREADLALNSIAQAEGAAMKLTFLRDVDAKSFRSAFIDGWKKNGVSESDPWAKNFLEKIQALGEQKKGNQLLLAAIKSKSGEVILVDNFSDKQMLFPSQSEDRKKVFSLWLGNPADSGLEDLKLSLLGK